MICSKEGCRALGYLPRGKEKKRQRGRSISRISCTPLIATNHPCFATRKTTGSCCKGSCWRHPSLPRSVADPMIQSTGLLVESGIALSDHTSAPDRETKDNITSHELIYRYCTIGLAPRKQSSKHVVFRRVVWFSLPCDTRVFKAKFRIVWEDE